MSSKTPNPYLVLTASIIPGAGHVWLGQAQRGLMWLFFTIILGWVSTKIIPEQMSFFSRHVGGILIYGLSILDAYKTARLRAYLAETQTLDQPGKEADCQ
jgi:hypothetical protein